MPTKQIFYPTFCFYPTTVLLIDDNQAFLDNLQLNLNPHLIFSTCTQPKEVLEIITNQKEKSPRAVIDNCFKKNNYIINESDNFPDHTLSIDLSELYHAVYNPNRSDFIITLIIDHDMPGMKGLELCNHLKNNSVKKIMLTGAAEANIAVDAFNKGIIDQFILKNSN